jgi:DNA-binding MarR family transcriptional regulator
VPSDADLGPVLSGRLMRLLKRAQLELAALNDELLAPFGIGHRELAVLLFLDAREPESQQQAAQRLGVDRTSMVGLIDGLEGKGLVARRPDPADRRRNVIALTDAGVEALRGATAASDQAERQLLAGLDEGEAERFREFLGRIATER